MFLDYPSKGDMRGQFGLNLADYFQNFDYRFTTRAENLYRFRKTERRRQGFTRLNTEAWTGQFRGGMELLDNYGNARLLVGTLAGSVEEIHDDTSHTTTISGLTAGREISMAAAYGAAFVANGADALRRIDGEESPATPATARRAGVPAAPANFTAVAGIAGTRTGNYSFLATTAIEDGLGTTLLESNLSNIVQITTLTADAVTFGWDDPKLTDDRATHVYIYGTVTGGAVWYRVRKVALNATGYADDDTLDSALGVPAPLLGRNIPPPDAPELVELSGTRTVLLKGDTLYISPPALNAYDAESFPYQIKAPRGGKIKAIRTIPNAGGQANTNSLFFAGERGAHILFNTNPQQPVVTLSEDDGVVNWRAVITRGRFLFFVDRRRGVMFWPGEGDVLYAISEKINPIFSGGGNQSRTANQGDENIALVIWRDHLLVTVRDDSSKTGPNKAYYMDLLNFERNWAMKGPENAAVWGGPWTGVGFGHMIARYDRDLVVLDNQNNAILHWDSTTFKDYVAGEEVEAKPYWRLGPAGIEDQEMQKRIHRMYWYGYSGGDTLLRIIGEEGRFDRGSIRLRAKNYSNLPNIDLNLIDISILNESGKAEAGIDWANMAAWFQFEFSPDNADLDWIVVGAKMKVTTQKVMAFYA
jgi:hypothetical protein